MIGVLGSTVDVHVYPSWQARRSRTGYTVRRVNIISAGPAGSVADWGLAVDGPKREWFLVRKGQHPAKWEAVAGDKGEPKAV